MKSVFQKLIKGFILFGGAVLLLSATLYYIWEGTKLYNYRTTGTIFTTVDQVEDSLLVFEMVDSLDFALPVIPASGDTLVSIADTTAVGAVWAQYFRSPQKPDTTIPLEFIDEGMVQRTMAQLRRPPGSEIIQLFMLEIIRVLLTYSFLGIGLYAFIKRSDSAGIRALTLFCYGMAVMFITGVSAIGNRYAAFEIPLFATVYGVISLFSVFIGSFWMNLQLLFPRPKRFIIKSPFWAYIVCYFPTIALTIINLIGVGTPALVNFGVFTAQITSGFVILGYSYSRAEDSLEKRQAKLVLWGSGIGLVLMALLVLFAGILFVDWFQSLKWNILIINLFFIPILLSPLSFAYAFGRYRLLEVEGKLRRGTRYVTVTVLMLAFFIGIIYAVGELLIRQFGIIDRTPTFLVALTLALGFTPAWRRVQVYVERRIYPERHHLRQMVRNFLQQIISIPDRRNLWQQIDTQLLQSFGIEEAYHIIRIGDDSSLYCDKPEQPEPTPFRTDHEALLRLQSTSRPMLVDEAIDSGRIVVTAESYAWLKTHRIVVLLPLVVQSRLVGLLGLCPKNSGDDFSAEDIQILTTFASQVALALENIRLLEDNLDKKRMEEELRFANRIQRGFLPAAIPETPGLEIAAESQSCLEVAGDYYDVIALPGGDTVMAVGDVSGKGAGAALIMANLQASLRTAVGVSENLAEVVARINDLIYQNTPQEQYITFFAALYQPDEKRLSYVNAGHNPPVLIRSNGDCESLEAGGLILGCIPGAPYQQGEIDLQSGDLVLMFTDGLSEAMNASEEEFGEERVRDIVCSHHEKAPEDILRLLKAEAFTFTGDQPWQDDLTLLLARVL